MSLLALVGMLLPVATVWLLLQATRWDRDSETAPPSFILALAVGIGLGASSCTYFLSLLVFNGARAGVIALDIALLAGAGAFAWQRRPGRSRAATTRARFSTRDRLLAAALLAAAVTAAIAFYINTLEDPHGQWDAWTTWNLRARWLLRAGALWRGAFLEYTSHADYPLLVPAAVARLWLYAGSEDTGVPAALAAAYSAALVLLLYGVLAGLRGRSQGLLGAICLLGTPLLLRSAAWQYADVPLAFNILAGVALLAAFDHAPQAGRSALTWAGVATGLAAWTKNEGMLFVACVAAARCALALYRRHLDLVPVRWFVAGLAPIAAVVLIFKLFVSPPGVFGRQHPADMLARAADPARYPAIARATGFEGVRGGGALLIALTIYMALLGRTRDEPARRAAGATGLTLAFVAFAYCAVYLVSPANLSWLLGHSLDRLVLHLWPSALFAFFLYAASPSELVAPAAVARARPRAAAASARARSGRGRARGRRG
jgi:hypothetical protein